MTHGSGPLRARDISGLKRLVEDGLASGPGVLVDAHAIKVEARRRMKIATPAGGPIDRRLMTDSPARINETAQSAINSPEAGADEGRLT